MTSLCVLVCGSREWADREAIRRELERLQRLWSRFTVIHGDNPAGADAIADEVGREMGLNVIPYPAKWPPHGSPRWLVAKAGHARNESMLAEGKPDRVLAFKRDFNWRMDKGGSEHMVSISLAAGVPCWLDEGNGLAQLHNDRLL